MTLEDFKINAPEPGQMLILRDDLYQVRGITIHRTDCALNSYDASLNQLTGITIQLDAEIIVEVNSVVKYGSYYYLEVVPFEFLEEPNREICQTLLLEPFNENISLDFRNSVFYPLYNNVPETLTQAAIDSIFQGKIEMRRGKNIYDVDRKNDAIIPTNIVNILEDTANLAEFPESNYHSLSNTTGRYLGSKTSETDYGTNPILGLTPFEGSIYQATTTTSSICNQPYDQRVIETIGFDSILNFNRSEGYLPEAKLPKTRDGYISGSFGNEGTLHPSQSVIELNVFNDKAHRIQPGRIAYITSGLSVSSSYMEITNVERIGPINSTESLFKLTVLRGIDGVDKNLIGAIPADPSFTLEFRTVDSDIVYEFDQNKPIRLSNKRIYIQETGDIYKAGPKGKLLYKETTCN